MKATQTGQEATRPSDTAHWFGPFPGGFLGCGTDESSVTVLGLLSLGPGGGHGSEQDACESTEAVIRARAAGPLWGPPLPGYTSEVLLQFTRAPPFQPPRYAGREK